MLKPDDFVKRRSDDMSPPLSVVDALKLKHPPRLPFCSSLLLDSTLPPLEDIDITGAHIAQVAHRIQGSGGPGGSDSSHWKDSLLHFGSHSARCRDALAYFTSLLSHNLTDWNLIYALLANRLIALDKNPGIRPIGIGETLRRIMCKTICLVTRDDVEEVCGSDQLCARTQCAIEGAVHAMSDLFDENEWGLLLVDAKNAFNSINRSSLLWNVRILWPRASRRSVPPDSQGFL